MPSFASYMPSLHFMSASSYIIFSPRTILILDCHHDLASPEGNGSNGKSILLPSPIHLSEFLSGEYFVQVHLCVLLGGLFIRFGRWLSPTKQGITEITVECHSSSYYSFFSSFFLNLCFLLYFSSSKHALSHWVGVWVCGLHCKQLRFVVVGVWVGLQQSALEVLQ